MNTLFDNEADRDKGRAPRHANIYTLPSLRNADVATDSAGRDSAGSVPPDVRATGVESGAHAFEGYEVRYVAPEWTIIIDEADMPEIEKEFDDWSKKAMKHLPMRLKERVHMIRLSCGKPRHVGAMVDLIAQAYGYIIEKREAKAA